MKSMLSKIVLCTVLCLGLGIASSFSTIAEIKGWYDTIQKPTWNPPNWIFGPVWSTLYLLMGIAVARVWHIGGSNSKTAITTFIIQFVLNIAWSYIFFAKHEIGFALAELIIMWICIFITIVLFSRIDKVAAWLLVPYISWVTFAGILNFTIWQLNR